MEKFYDTIEEILEEDGKGDTNSIILGDWKHRFRNSVKDAQTLPGADIESDHNLLVAKVRTRLKKIIRFQNSRPRWDLEKLYAERQRVQNILEGKLGAIECESGNAEVQWKI